MKGRPTRTKKDVDGYVIDQLMTKFVIDDNDCWLWTGAYYQSGYARISRHRPVSEFHHRAHIASYQLHKGKVPKDIYVCHSCDVKGCINPEHLWLGTNQANQLDAVKKGVFKKIWTPEKRAASSRRYSGAGNPMYGRTGKDAPAYGRTGKKHPMFGKHHTEESKQKISTSLRKAKQ